MFKLFLRQLKKHRAGLIPVAIVWILGGYVIFTNHHACLATLSRWTVTLPGPGEQRPAAAMQYVEAARELIADDEIRLDLMHKMCNRHELRQADERDLYRPHWLEKIRSWNLAEPGSPSRVVEPSEYWDEHRATVLDALRSAVNAQALAFEITPGDLGLPEGETILVPAEVARYARAVCRPQIAVLAWGDYVEFQEVRAFQKLQTGEPELAENYAYPAEQQILILSALQEDPNYLRALREYGAGEPPLPEVGGTCADGNFRLACGAPLEAVKVLNKQLYFAPARSRPLLHLRLGALHRVLERETSDPQHLGRALDHYAGATESAPTEEEGRLNLARIFLMLADRSRTASPDAGREHRLYYERAYEELKQISLIKKGQGLTDDEFRELARHILIGLDRFRDADCFADLAHPTPGTDGLTRPHCKDLRL